MPLNSIHKISIGMPVYNCSHTVEVAIRSILNQTFSDLELIIIDDGSNDGTPEIISKFSDKRLRLILGSENQGLPSRLNQALMLSKGIFFARMDGDDVSYPNRMCRQMDFLEKHPNIDLVGSGMLVFKQDGIPIGKRLGPESHGDICKCPQSGFPLAHPTYFGRRAWFLKYLYRTDAIRCEDQDLLLRSFRDSRFANLNEILLGYRESELNLKGILKGRYYYTKCISREAKHQRSPFLTLSGILMHIFKGFFDIIAIGSGLKHLLLRQRAKPISMSDGDSWNQVWQSLQK